MTPLQNRLLAGSLPQTVIPPVISNVKVHVVTNVPTVPGHSQKKEISPGPVDCTYKDYTLKSVKSVSCVIPLSCAKSVTSVKHATKILENLVESRGRPENSSNPKGRLHPPLPGPAKSYKVTNCRKLLWQSPQEQLPAGGITSAYRQKCSRAGQKSIISGVFQPTLFGPKAKQQVEANSGSEQTKSLSQGGEIQDGDTGNHQNIPPTRGVGYLSRFQRCLLPHTNTGTIKEIPKISCPGSDVPVQGITFWPVNSTHGVHCFGKGGQTDGHTQGYKNPPVPRRLASTGQVLPNLSPTYTTSSPDVSRARLVGEFRKIRTGTQTGLRLRRLPVQPQVRPGQTDPVPVAEPTGQNPYTSVTTGLSGPAVHVPDRSPNSHRKTGSLRPTSYETHTVASQKQLESSGIFREGYPSTQVPPHPFAMVARRKQCALWSTVTPSKTCSANLYRRIKRRVGRSLK